MKRTVTYIGLFLLASAVALAQGPQAGGRQRQGGGRPTGQRQGGMRIPGMRMLDRPLTISQVPGATLKAVFKLTDEQDKKVQDIQSKAMEDIRALMPRPQPGQRFDASAFESIRPKIDAIIKGADQKIMAVLNADQKKRAPALLKEMQALRNSGLPMSLAGSLKLTDAQIAKLEAIGKERSEAMRKLFEGNQDRMAAMQQMGQIREDARKKALGVLNAAQKAAVEKWEKEHPRRAFMGGGPGGPGGPGMMGGPRPGGPAGPDGARPGGGGRPGGRTRQPGGGR